MTPDAVAANLAAVRAKIAEAARLAGRPADAVTLVAVSKTHDADAVRAALAAGQRVFGENRVQEAKAKYPALKAEFPDLELHLIGPLQTNKVRDAVALFDAIETVDRPRLAEALAAEMTRQDRYPPCLIQVNVGEEPQKAGVLPAEADDFVRRCRDAWNLPIRGVMCIPPADQDPRPYFESLAALARRWDLPVVSMGMSGDYPEAVAFGATHVRVGSAIFGARPPAGAV